MQTDYKANIELLPKEQGGRRVPIFTGYSPDILFNKGEKISCVIKLVGRDQINPGEQADVLIDFKSNNFSFSSPYFEIFENGHLVGKGQIA